MHAGLSPDAWGNLSGERLRGAGVRLGVRETERSRRSGGVERRWERAGERRSRERERERGLPLRCRLSRDLLRLRLLWRLRGGNPAMPAVPSSALCNYVWGSMLLRGTQSVALLTSSK